MSIPPFFFRHPYFPTQECVGYGQREDIRIASACVILNAVRNLGQQVVRQGGFSKGHAARPSERILRDRQTQPTLPCYATVGRDSFPPFYTHGKLIAGRDRMSLRSLNVIRRKNPCPIHSYMIMECSLFTVILTSIIPNEKVAQHPLRRIM